MGEHPYYLILIARNGRGHPTTVYIFSYEVTHSESAHAIDWLRAIPTDLELTQGVLRILNLPADMNHEDTFSLDQLERIRASVYHDAMDSIVIKGHFSVALEALLQVIAAENWMPGHPVDEQLMGDPEEHGYPIRDMDAAGYDDLEFDIHQAEHRRAYRDALRPRVLRGPA